MADSFPMRFPAFLSLAATAVALTFTPFMSHSEETPHLRKPLPPAETIAKLPPDGGTDFNRLIFEKSPYLLQHAANPVDWHPWGEEAFRMAKEQNKPVFLSIGYTTCHWCHVMEHESFEDEGVAAVINAGFIPVKVDREERPDIDEIYMTVTQALTGSGGWPMTVMLTPDKKPFFAGTYIPKTGRGGRPGIVDLLNQLTDAWKNRRAEIDSVAENIAGQLKDMTGGSPGGALAPDTLDNGSRELARRFDAANGGFGSQPKFPTPANLLFLLRHWKRSGDAKDLEMVEKSLVSMHQGGVYDQVGHGIHRYSTDAVWLVPHFEKMLYDQAMMTLACVETYQATGKEDYARMAREILGYVLCDMTSPEGGFYSAEDADSEGVEGKFYVWTVAEIKAILGTEDAAFYIQLYNLTPEGNFSDEASGKVTGANIPHLRSPLTDEERKRLEPMRQKLFFEREKRVHPQKDDKILTDWNGLMIAAFAKAGQVLGDEAYTAAAKKAADFVIAKLSRPDGRLLKRYRHGEAGLTAHLEDYAFLTWGLLDLYETCFDPIYLEHAVRLNQSALDHFWDPQGGAFFMTANDAESLIARSKKIYGGAYPSGNAAALLNLVRLHRITGDSSLEEKADALIKAFSADILRQPSAFPFVLCGADFLLGPSLEIVIAGDPAAADTKAMIAALRKPYLPSKVVLLRPDGDAPPVTKVAAYTAAQTSIDGKATAYVCRNFACNLPVTEIGQMLELMKK